MLAIPLCFSLFYSISVFKDSAVSRANKILLSSALASILCVSVLNFSMGGVIFRYSADITAIAIPLSLFLLFSFYTRLSETENGGTKSASESIAYTLCMLLLFATFAVCALVTISRNPNLSAMSSEGFCRLFNFFVFWR